MSTPTERSRLAGTRWDPAQYMRYGDERLRPAIDLLARVQPAAPRTVVDLGCGTGNITRLLAERWPDAAVIGVDHSAQMLAAAAAEPSTVRWVEADAYDWAPAAPVDVLFSNATLQWLQGHDVLLPRWLGHVAPGGWLAVQMPLNWGAPSHRLMRETLADGGPGGRPLGSPELRASLAEPWVAEPERYYDILAGAADDVDVWETTYLHILDGEDPVVEWVKGTGLRPVLNALEDGERATFMAEYARRVRAAYPRGVDGRTVFPFRRVFMVARGR
ncbi:MAG: methyltransferase domain-containing protein [Ardenticatenales bacterium]